MTLATSLQEQSGSLADSEVRVQSPGTFPMTPIQWPPALVCEMPGRGSTRLTRGRPPPHCLGPPQTRARLHDSASQIFHSSSNSRQWHVERLYELVMRANL